jgi:hypothetical protein
MLEVLLWPALTAGCSLRQAQSIVTSEMELKAMQRHRAKGTASSLDVNITVVRDILRGLRLAPHKSSREQHLSIALTARLSGVTPQSFSCSTLAWLEMMFLRLQEALQRRSPTETYTPGHRQVAVFRLMLHGGYDACVYVSFHHFMKMSSLAVFNLTMERVSRDPALQWGPVKCLRLTDISARLHRLSIASEVVSHALHVDRGGENQNNHSPEASPGSPLST